MESQELANWLRTGGAIAVAILAYLGIRLNHQLRNDAWTRALRDFHQFFWTDDDCQKVRSWIACDVAYLTILPVLQKRRLNLNISEEKYEILEKIDKCFALLVSYNMLSKNKYFHRRSARRFFDEYWITETKKRHELYLYGKKFYKELFEPRSTAWEKLVQMSSEFNNVVNSYLLKKKKNLQ